MPDFAAAPSRRLKARYSFAGGTAEIEQTLPLAAGENVFLHGALRLHDRWFPRPALVRLTGPRLVILTHYAFHADYLWELPRAAVDSATKVGAVLHIGWTDERHNQKVLRLVRWSGRSAPDNPIADIAEVHKLVNGWLDEPRTPTDAT